MEQQFHSVDLQRIQVLADKLFTITHAEAISFENPDVRLFSDIVSDAGSIAATMLSYLRVINDINRTVG